jgi:hypothetical protein
VEFNDFGVFFLDELKNFIKARHESTHASENWPKFTSNRETPGKQLQKQAQLNK